jgi:glycosyltransferase involved in cell wall biosynthesis
MSAPLVSVIIPTYNRAATLRRTVDSALAQTYQPVEVIVVDDGSADGTVDVLRSYGDRIHAITQPNGGPSAARNTGAKAANGEWLAFLDSDDVWKPEKIGRQVRMVTDRVRKIDCCMANAAIINEDGSPGPTTFDVSGVGTRKPDGYWLNPAALFASRFILFNQVALIRREAFVRVGGFNPELRLLEDHDLAFRLALGGPWAFVADPLVEKYNDTMGIGVAAMADPLAHCRAWERVLRGFLADGLAMEPKVRALLEMALWEVGVEMRLIGMKAGTSGLACLGRCGMFALRKYKSLRRKLPGWPRADISGDPGTAPVAADPQPLISGSHRAEGDA